MTKSIKIMKKFLILIIVVVLVILTGIIFYDYQQASEEPVNSSLVSNSSLKTTAPHVVVEPLTYDFGRVKFGDVSEHIFTVKNTGGTTLLIEGISTSCACTSGAMAQKEIAPGQQADLVVRFDPAVHEDDTDLGELTRTVYLATNDPVQEEIEVKIYADVYQ